MNRLRSVLEVASGVAMLVASTVLVWKALSIGPAPSEAAQAPPEVLILDDVPSIGSPSASVGIVVFSDFECPYCQKFASSTWPSLKAELVDTGQVRIYFRHLPLRSLHGFAQTAAEAAECANRLGKFWSFHDALFAAMGREKTRKPSPGVLSRVADELGLNTTRYQACVTGSVAERVALDVAEARRLGVSGMPKFYIGQVTGNRLLVVETIRGAQGLAEFHAAVARASQ